MSIGKIYFYGVMADGLRGFCARLWLVHWQNAGWNRARRAGRGGNFRGLFCALIAACGAGTILAQINKIVMAGVIVRPDDVHTFASGDVNFHVGGFLAGVEWSRHIRFHAVQKEEAGSSAFFLAPQSRSKSRSVGKNNTVPRNDCEKLDAPNNLIASGNNLPAELDFRAGTFADDSKMYRCDDPVAG
jgi:hypothetical protein